MTMTTGSTIAPPMGTPDGASRMMTWMPAPDVGRAGCHQTDRAGTPQDRAALLRATADARTALRDAAVAATEAAARARSLAALLDETLAALAAAERTPVPVPALAASPPDTNPLPLSPREWEVLALVAEGRSNKAIAAALYVSPNTVKTHVASLLSKLHADSRVQLAAIATTRDLRQHATIGVR